MLVAGVFVHGIAVAVTHGVRVSAAGRQRRRGPERTAVVVADEHAPRLADR